MNFNNFDDNTEDYVLNAISLAKEAEKNIYTNPKYSIKYLREALEGITKYYARINNISMIDDCGKDKDLYTLINDVYRHKYISIAHSIRKAGNTATHYDDRANYSVNNELIEYTKKVTENLYKIFNKVLANSTKKDFNPDLIPFGQYEIIDRVPTTPNADKFYEYSYFVKSKKDNRFIYFYDIEGDSDSYAFSKRINEAIDVIEDSTNDMPYVLMVAEKPEYDENNTSQWKYVIYKTKKGSALLKQKKYKLSEKDILKIALNLTSAVIALKKNGIHLRSIQPDNIIIYPSDDTYTACIFDMQKAKIESSDTTVFTTYHKVIEDDCFVAPEIRNSNSKNLDALTWEKADIFSIAATMVYCVDENLVKKYIDLSNLYNCFSEETADILCEVIGGSLEDTYTAEEFKEKLQIVYEQYE